MIVFKGKRTLPAVPSSSGVVDVLGLSAARATSVNSRKFLVSNRYDEDRTTYQLDDLQSLFGFLNDSRKTFHDPVVKFSETFFVTKMLQSGAFQNGTDVTLLDNSPAVNHASIISLLISRLGLSKDDTAELINILSVLSWRQFTELLLSISPMRSNGSPSSLGHLVSTSSIKGTTFHATYFKLITGHVLGVCLDTSLLLADSEESFLSFLSTQYKSLGHVNLPVKRGRLRLSSNDSSDETVSRKNDAPRSFFSDAVRDNSFSNVGSLPANSLSIDSDTAL